MRYKTNINLYTFGGLSGFLIFYVIVMIGVYIPVLIFGNQAGILMVTFHFVINPIIAVCYITLTIIKFFKMANFCRYFYIFAIFIVLYTQFYHYGEPLFMRELITLRSQ